MAQLPSEPVGISPRVDCVFRALMGDAEHVERLVHFLNAVVQRPSPIVEVTIRNPIQPSDFVDDGHIVVDVIAKDAAGEVFQVDMQSWNHAALKERMLYTWATLYKAQLEKGDEYNELRPVVCVWVLDENAFRNAEGFHHRFRVRDDAGTLELSSQFEVHVLELERWRNHPDSATAAALLGWMRFFTEAQGWRVVPPEIDNPILESAMAVLTDFQTNAARNDLYRSRLDFLRVQKTMVSSLEEALADKARTAADLERALTEKEQAVARAEQAVAEKEQAVAREERLKARLRALGVDPDGG